MHDSKINFSPSHMLQINCITIVTITTQITGVVFEKISLECQNLMSVTFTCSCTNRCLSLSHRLQNVFPITQQNTNYTATQYFELVKRLIALGVCSYTGDV